MPILALLELLTLATRNIVAGYKRLKIENPALSDEDVIGQLRTDSQRLIDEAEAWLAAHPE